MGKKKPAAEAESPPLPSWKQTLLRVSATLVVGGIVLFAVWSSLPQVTGQSISTEEIEITPQPPGWIRSDLREQVFANSLFQQPLSVLEPELTEEIAAAFALHPWVEKVESVLLQPSGEVFVRLKYREPVLMVEIGEPLGLYPVDKSGVLLPSEDFSAFDAYQYPRLGKVDTTPNSPGTVWPDRRVEHAAALAVRLKPYWRQWDLLRMVARGREVLDAPDAAPTFEIYPNSTDAAIYWGHAPGWEVQGEPTAQAKLAYLVQFVQRTGSPASPGGLDLTQLPAVAAEPADSSRR